MNARLPTLRFSRPVTFLGRSTAGSSRGGRPAASPTSSLSGGLFAVLLGWAALFGLLVVAPIAMLASGAAPESVLGWWALIGVSWGIAWWNERREQRRWQRQHGGPPRQPTSPCAEEFRRRHGLAEECCETAEESPPEAARGGFWGWAGRWMGPEVKAAPASPPEPIPAFIVAEQPGSDGVYSARPYMLTDALADAMQEAEAAGLGREVVIDRMAAVLRGSLPASGSSKASKQPASRGGAGGPQGGRGRVRGGAERLGRGGPKGYLGGGR